MTNMQRMKSDMATIDRRDLADETVRHNRVKNDELTNKRREKADESMEEKRLRNDEMTANRRETKDGNFNLVLALSLVVAVLAAGVFLT